MLPEFSAAQVACSNHTGIANFTRTGRGCPIPHRALKLDGGSGQSFAVNGTIDETMNHARIKLVFFDASRMFAAGKIGVSSGGDVYLNPAAAAPGPEKETK